MSTSTIEAPTVTTEPAAPAETDTDTAPVKATRRRSTRRTTSRSSSTRRSSTTSDKADARPRRSTPRRPAIGTRMSSMYATMGLGLSMAPHPVAQTVGLQLVANSAECGKAWEQLAKDDPRVAAALDRLLTVSAYGALVTAHLPIVIAALVASGKVPAGLVGMMGGAGPAGDAEKIPGSIPAESASPAPADPGSRHLVDVLAGGQNAGGRP